MFLIGALILLVLPVGITLGLSFLLRLWGERLARRWRIALAALGGGMGTMAIPVGAAASAGDATAVGAILIVGLVLSLVIGLPVALVIARGENTGNGPVDPGVFG